MIYELRTYYAMPLRLPDLNRRTRFCRPVPNHSAKAPERANRSEGYGPSTSSRNARARVKQSIRFGSFAIIWPSSS